MIARKARGGQLAEFGPVLWVFFLLIVFPLIDLFSFLWAVATVMLIANVAARDAGAAQTFSQAENQVLQRAGEFGNFRGFAKMTPAAGTTDGVNVVCLVTEAQTSSTAAPRVYRKGDRVPTSAADLTDNVYQYAVNAEYDVMPLFNLAGVPFVADVPGLGRPVPIKFTAMAAVEHPDGLND